MARAACQFLGETRKSTSVYRRAGPPSYSQRANDGPLSRIASIPLASNSAFVLAASASIRRLAAVASSSGIGGESALRFFSSISRLGRGDHQDPAIQPDSGIEDQRSGVLSRADAQLLVGSREVALDRALGQEQSCGDL